MVKREVNTNANITRRSGEIADHNHESMRDSIRRQVSSSSSRQTDGFGFSTSQPPILSFAATPPRRESSPPRLSFDDTPPVEPESKKIKLSFT